MTFFSYAKKKMRGSLAVRQLGYILIFSSLITFLSAGLQIFIEYRTDIKDVHMQLEQIGKGYLESLTASVWKLDDEQVNVELNDALSHRDIEYLEITENGQVLFSAGKMPETGGMIVREFDLVFMQKDTLRPLGTLKAVASLKGTYLRTVRRILLIIVTQGVKTFFVSFFILFIIYRLVIRHLVDLGRYSRRLDFNTKNVKPFILDRSRSRRFGSDDELDDLVNAVNTMRIQVAKDIEDIRNKEARYRQTIESIKDGFCILDADGIIIDVNRAYCEIIGAQKDQLMGMALADLEPGLSASKVKERFERIKTNGSGLYETCHSSKSGEVVNFEVSATYGTQDAESMFFLFLRDITERIQREKEKDRLEQQLRQAQKMESLGTLAGGIAHDFNNILVPILGNTEMLMDDLDDNTGLGEYLAEIHTSTMRARDLVKQILTFSRQQKQKIGPMDITPVLKEALKLLRATFPSSITINTEISEDLPKVNADVTQIHQVILNLATNAFHAMEKDGGQLTVRLNTTPLNPGIAGRKNDLPGQWLKLSIEDTGHGMDHQMMEKIFDPFFTTKQHQKGTGLGLSMVHGIVTGYGGNIELESHPGSGTRFDIYLPVTEKPIREKKGKPEADILPHGQEHILVVDDEPAVLSVEAQMLSRLGYMVTLAESGHQALNLVKSDPDEFDLVITDMTMPNMTGDVLAKTLAQVAGDLPVLICTGFSKRVDSIPKGGNIRGVLLKPLVMKELAQQLRNALDMHGYRSRS